VEYTDCIGSRDLIDLARAFPGLEEVHVTVDTLTWSFVDVPAQLRRLTYTDAHMATTLRFPDDCGLEFAAIRCGGVSGGACPDFDVLETTETGYVEWDETGSKARDLRIDLAGDLLMTTINADAVTVTTNSNRVVFDFRELRASPCASIRVRQFADDDAAGRDDDDDAAARSRRCADVVFINAEFQEFIDYFYVRREKDLIVGSIDVMFRPPEGLAALAVH
jgi:hypothetical protein